MKITFMSEGVVHEFTPPDFATNVVIKTRANGVSIDYESSTMEAVQDFFDRADAEADRHLTAKKSVEPVNVPATTRSKKGVGWKLSNDDRDAIVVAWTKEKPQPSYDALASRYGIHRTTVSDIIHKALNKPYRAKAAPKAPKAPPVSKGRKNDWNRRRISDAIRNKVVALWNTGKYSTATAVGKKVGISTTSAKRILNGVGVTLVQGGTRTSGTAGRHKSLSPFQEEEVMRLIDEGAIARQAIADKFKVNMSTVNRVLAKKRREKEDNFQHSLEVVTDGNV